MKAKKGYGLISLAAFIGLATMLVVLTGCDPSAMQGNTAYHSADEHEEADHGLHSYMGVPEEKWESLKCADGSLLVCHYDGDSEEPAIEVAEEEAAVWKYVSSRFDYMVSCSDVELPLPTDESVECPEGSEDQFRRAIPEAERVAGLETF